MRSRWLALIAGIGVLHCWAQQSEMRIVLEQQMGSAFRVVNPQHVFKTGDMIRFRVRSSSDGFLYVSNRAASGKYEELFPAKGADNRLERDKDYRIPASSRSWFRIDKPAGYETIFFTFTSAPLVRRNQTYPKPVPQAPAAELIPRCDDALFRARGECLDVNAGAQAGGDGLTARDVSVVQGPDVSVVTPASAGDAPIVYEFRIAHR
jgi:Domain of unknown function (DUF4384)